MIMTELPTEEEFQKFKTEVLNIDPREVNEDPGPDPLVEELEKKEGEMEMPRIDNDADRMEYEDLVNRMAIAKKRYPVEKVWLSVEYIDKLNREHQLEGVLFMLSWPLLQIEKENGGKWGKTTYIDMRKMHIVDRDYRVADEIGYPKKTWKKSTSSKKSGKPS
jgi:hypothetical protein